MPAKKLALHPAADAIPACCTLRVDDPRMHDFVWGFLLHDGSLVAGQPGGRIVKVSTSGERTTYEAGPTFSERGAKPSRDGRRVAAISDKKSILELDTSDGSVTPLYSVERDSYLSDGITSVDYLGDVDVIAEIGENLVLLRRGANGRLAEHASQAHKGFSVSSAADRFVISHQEKALRFYAPIDGALVELGSIALKWGQVGEVLVDGLRRVVVRDEKTPWSFVEGLEAALEAKSAPAKKPKSKASGKGKASSKPAKVTMVRNASGPTSDVVGVSAKGRKVAAKRSLLTMEEVDGTNVEIASYEPGTEIYVASVHPSEETVLVGAAEVFPAPLVEIDLESKAKRELGFSVRRAGYVGDRHLVVLDEATDVVSLRERAKPEVVVFELATTAKSLLTHPATGLVVLTGISGGDGKNQPAELHRLNTDSAVTLVHLANLSPSSKRLVIYFAHQLLVEGTTVRMRSMQDWYEFDGAPLGVESAPGR